MGIWASINDKCWPLVEKLHLSEIFEKFHLPPVLLPLCLILLLLFLLFAFSGGAPAANCGDGVCSPSLNESITSCPADCAGAEPAEEPSFRRLTVMLSDIPTCPLRLRLYDSEGKQVASQRKQDSTFTFDGIDVVSVSVNAEGPYGETRTTPQISLDEVETTTDFEIPDSMCEAPRSSNGVLRVSITDRSTGDPLNGVSVSIAETQNGQILNYVIHDNIINGMRDFTLPHSKYYAIYAQKEGYVGYDGTGEEILVPDDRPASKTIELVPSGPGTGELEVCATSEEGPLTSGLIVIQELSGNLMLTGGIARADPDTEPSPGCYVFKDITAGKIISASMPSPPAGCVPAVGEPPTTTIEAGSRNMLEIAVDCEPSGIGYLKVKVTGKGGAILTGNSTITVWTSTSELVPGKGLANSLAVGAGGYTEEVQVPAEATLYVWVRGLPLGYLDYKSQGFMLTGGEHKALELALNYTPAPLVSKDFSFIGVSSPLQVAQNSTFEVLVDRIIYAGTDLDDSTVEVTAAIGGNDCTVSYDVNWELDCMAPALVGQYNVTIKADHSGVSGTYAVPIKVLEYRPGMGLLTLRSVLSPYGTPPLDLYYEILFNGTPVTSLTAQDITMEYADSPGAYPGEVSELVLAENGYWMMSADVPYKGDYRLEIYIQTATRGALYDSNYAVSFTTTANSEKLKAEPHLSKTILATAESFRTDVTLTFGDRMAYGLEIFEAYLGNGFYTLNWNPATQLYTLQMAALPYEICTAKMRFVVKDAEVGEPVVLQVVDLSKSKAGTCPLDLEGTCSNIEEVRRCVYNSNTKAAFYPPEQLSACVVSGCGIAPLAQCPSSNTGDLDLDCRLEEPDIVLMEQYLQTISSMTERNALADCMDMDNDMDVDEEDLLCLRNVVATKWYGDSIGMFSGQACGDGTMNGGFCFDIDTDSPIPGDIVETGNLDLDDEGVMGMIIDATKARVKPNEDLLAVADFNQDGRINNADLECLRAFKGVDFQTGELLQVPWAISKECMNIFNLECTTGRGDVNGDAKIDELDLIVVKLIADSRIPPVSNIAYCADVNGDVTIDDNDVACIESYLTGDMERWTECLGCDITAGYYNDYEICNDGYDNDCDGKIDDVELCGCNEDTPCESTYDMDGGSSPGIADGNYKVCRKVSWSLGTSVRSSVGGTSEYTWVDASEIADNCNDGSDWNASKNYYCAGRTFYCVFDYPEGFHYPDTGEEDQFTWFESENVGPIGRITAWESYPSCATGWNQIGESTVSVHVHCMLCRYEYDFCEDYDCDGTDTNWVGLYHCGAGWQPATDAQQQQCTVDTECVPETGDTASYN